MKPLVVNVRFDSFDVYVGRANNARGGFEDSLFRNPYKVGEGCTEWYAFNDDGDCTIVPHYNVFVEDHATCIEFFIDYVAERCERDKRFAEALQSLRGKTLGCWCKGPNGADVKLCHGDILAMLVNE